MLQPPSPQRAPVNKRTTMPSGTCGPMILASRMSSGHCIRPSVGPARPSSSSFELLRSPWHRCLMLSTWSTDKRNEETTLPGEDDSGDSPGPWPHVRKCLLIIYNYNFFCFLLVS